MQIGVEPNRVDVLQTLSGADFDQVWQNKVEATVDEGITAPVISKADLIENKLHAGRPRDLADVDELRRLK